MGASRVPSGPGVLVLRMVVGSFFVVVIPRPERRLGRFDFGFFGVLSAVFCQYCTIKVD